jgi:hypothetical protein
MYDVELSGSHETGVCACCGNKSHVVWGYVYRDGDAWASYHVHWTVGHVREHGANIDLILGLWGEGTSAADRVAVSLDYRLLENGPGFMVIDAGPRLIAKSGLVGCALARADVIGQPIAQDVFATCDAILPNDPRLAELLGEPPKLP